MSSAASFMLLTLEQSSRAATRRHRRAGPDDPVRRGFSAIADGGVYWMPAFAGMTIALFRRVGGFQRRIIRISLGVAAVERCLVGCVERRAAFEAFDQIGV